MICWVEQTIIEVESSTHKYKEVLTNIFKWNQYKVEIITSFTNTRIGGACEIQRNKDFTKYEIESKQIDESRDLGVCNWHFKYHKVFTNTKKKTFYKTQILSKQIDDSWEVGVVLLRQRASF